MKSTRSSVPPEAALYTPVKALLESQGYVVKGEIVGCDVVGVRGDEPPVVVELKRAFGLALVLQGIDRLALTDAVYLAVGAWPRRPAAARTLCRRLGLGLIVIADGRADVLLDPLPYQPRKSRARTTRLLDEHRRRVGDPTSGGSVRRPIMTAYRQEALRCAARLDAGPATLRAIRAVGDVPHASRIMQTNVYGWFERTGRGVYVLSPRGRRALEADRPEAPPDEVRPTGEPALPRGGHQHAELPGALVDEARTTPLTNGPPRRPGSGRAARRRPKPRD